MAAVLLALTRGDGLPATRVQLAGGGAWLASPAQGLVTLIDGPSEEVVGSVRVPAASGRDVSVVQAGASAYVVGGSGTVARLDGGTYEMSVPVQFGAGGRAGALQVHTGGSGTYVVDGERRTAAVVDPVSLRVRDELALAAQPGPGQSVVDDSGRLWVVDRGGVAWFDAAGKHVRPDAGGPAARLLLVRGRPVLADLAGARVAPLTDGTEPPSWSCLDVPAGDRPQLLGSAELGRVVAAVPATGALVLAGDGRDECGRSVSVGSPGDQFGPLVESAGYVLVPNRTRGRTAVVDVAARRVVADLPLVRPGHRLELVVEDGLVFYNDLDGDRAGVLRFDGRQWTVGAPVRKYRPGDPGLLVPGNRPDGTSPEERNRPPERRQPDRRPPDQRPPDQRADDPGRTDRDPRRPNAGGADPAGPGGTAPGGTAPGGQGPVAPIDGPPPPPPPDPVPPGEDDPPAGAARLSVQVAGAGMVTADQPAPTNVPAGAQCGADASCDWEYPVGTAVSLRVPNAPAAGVLLGGLTGCDSTTVTGPDTSCLLTLAADRTVRATFVADATPGPVTLTVTRTGPGALTAAVPGAAPASCDPTCTLPVPAGTSVELAAAPAGGAYLADWGAPECAPTASTCAIPVAADRAITVAFAPLVDLTVTLTGGSGRVAGTGLPSCAGPTCTASYRAGTVVDLKAGVDAGFEFAGWSGCTATGATTCTLTISGPTAVTATFRRASDRTPPNPTLSALGQAVGIGTGARSVEVRRGATVTASATATDPDSAVTGTEIWAEISWTCRSGGRNVPGHEDSRPRASGPAGSTTYTFSAGAALLCPGMTVLEATYRLRARATSEGGTSAFTDLLTVAFVPPEPPPCRPVCP